MTAPAQSVLAPRWPTLGLALLAAFGCAQEPSSQTPANLPPIVLVTAPNNGDNLQLGLPVQITASATDNDGSVVSVQFRDGPSFIDDDLTAPYAVSWTPVDLGSHTLTARATDNRGAVTVSPGIQVTVIVTGDAPPTAQLTAPVDQAQNLTGPLILTANANDDQSVAGVQFQVDGQNVGPEDTAAPYADTLTSLLTYATGVHVVRARARDNTGHFSAWATATVTFTGSAVPQGFSVSTFSGLPSGPTPTAMAFAPDGRLFVCMKNGSLLAKPFLTVPTLANGERGLLGVAFHPSFSTNGRVYVYYTVTGPPTHNRIARYVADGDTALSAETVIADLPTLSSATNHNGGAIHFGLDGKLYVGVGENANGANSQSLTTVLGKVLRFNDDGSIPGDNPFLPTTTGQNQAIWAMGLRNPFTFAVHPTTGRILIDDVGQSTWEEIDEGIAGANYGWPTTEGPTNDPSFVSPIYAYQHSSGLVTGSAIIGGAFYSAASPTFPAEYRENYFFADLSGGWINRMDPVNGNAVYAFADNLETQTGIALGPDGAIYSLTTVGGSWVVRRFQFP
jgi:glucose/arabinose dehydrogenase